MALAFPFRSIDKPRPLRGLLVAALALPLAICASAATLAPTGCPMSHCDSEASGDMVQPLMARITTMTNSNTLGTQKSQGCSGDGTRLACLFETDTATGTGVGTLKVLDATTLQPIWASGSAANSWNLDPASAAGAQVPLVFSDGKIAAGDRFFHVLYDTSGAVIGKLAVGGKGYNLGMTPVSDSYGVISQSDGVLTLVDLSTWQSLDTLTLRDPSKNGRVNIVVPSSATNDVLYVVTNNPANDDGVFYSVSIDPTAQKLKVGASYSYVGTSGAGAVVLTPATSGLANNLLLLHVPGLTSDPVPQNHLLGLVDNSPGFTVAWSIPLDVVLPVSPSIDAATQSLFFVYNQTNDSTVHQHNFLTGEPIQVFDIHAIGGLPPGLELNGHLASIQNDGGYTLLLSAMIKSNSQYRGQYAIAFSPISSPTRLGWTQKISSVPDKYTEAWNLAPARRAGLYCPVTIGYANGISRLCDF